MDLNMEQALFGECQLFSFNCGDCAYQSFLSIVIVVDRDGNGTQ